jgi:hypothetical protein
MAEQINTEQLRCTNCPVKKDTSFLVDIKIGKKKLLMLCPKKIKEKLLDLGYAPDKVNEVYGRFVENFARFPVCHKGAVEHELL